MGGNLVSIHSEADNSGLKAQANITNSSGLWIGANDIDSEGNWTWSDGMVVSFNDWAQSQPDNKKINQDCGYLRPGKGFQWDDGDCSKKKRYICSLSGKIFFACRKFFTLSGSSVATNK